MQKEKNIINYYVLCNKLKNVIRTGWKDWNVQRERLESVAEHIFGVQMLAIAMKSEYDIWYWYIKSYNDDSDSWTLRNSNMRFDRVSDIKGRKRKNWTWGCS